MRKLMLIERREVCLWHKADVPVGLTNVCFEWKNRHDAGVTAFPLMTESRHEAIAVGIGVPTVLQIFRLS